MDFVFESYTQVSDADKQKNGESPRSLSSASDLLPPVPSGSLKIPALPDDLTRKFSNLSILKTITQRKTSQLEIDDTKQEDNSLALKYAKNSLDLINATSLTTLNITPSDVAEGTTKANIPYSMLENRLSRVLNTTNFDSSVRQSLLVLQSRIDQNGQIKFRETSSTKDSIDAGSVNYSQLAGTGILGAVARRKLRSEVENDLLSQHYQALKKLQPIVKKLNVIKDDLEDLNEVYSIIQEKLTTQIDENSDFKATADKLSTQRDIINIKKEVLNSFKSSFTLNHYEEHTLRNEDISEEFFNVLAKVEKIYENCDVLLSLNNDKLGIDIMTKMKNLIDLSVDRLSLFVKKHLSIYFSNVSKPGSNGTSASLEIQKSNQSQIDSFQRALIYILQKRESKFDEVVSEIIQSRSQQVINDFLVQLNGYNDIVRKEQEEKRQQLALDSQKKKSMFNESNNLQGKNNYNPHPLIDFSYDSKRFLGDLLAYLHGIIANEREIIENLFDLNDDELSNSESSSKNMSLIIDSVVNKVIGSLSRPLKATLEQTLRQESKIVVVQSFFGLLDLYTVMLTKLLSKSGEVNDSSSIITTLNEMKESTIERVFNIIRLKLKSIKAESDSEEVTDELSIPDWLIDYYSEFFPVFENMDDAQRVFIGTTKIDELTSLIVDEPMKLLQNLKDKITTESGLSKRSYDILTINCLDFVSLKLTSIPALTHKLEEVTSQISDLKLKLERQEFDKLISNTGLSDIYNLINMIFSLDQDFFDLSIYEPITENKMFNRQTFIEADLKMTDFLPTVLIDQEDTDLSKLVSPSIASDIVVDSSLEFVDFYYKLLLIVDTYLRPRETDGADYFRWDDLRVATLLGVEEQYLKQKVDYSAQLDD